jgi:hypothetical protein
MINADLMFRHPSVAGAWLPNFGFQKEKVLTGFERIDPRIPAHRDDSVSIAHEQENSTLE